MDPIINKEVMKYLCGCICCTTCCVGFLLIFFGFSSLEATELGLNYSWISKTISPRIHENGLYFIGIGHSFIKFPKTVQTIEFSLEKHSNRGPIESRTSDGLEVSIEISFQYTLQPDKLYSLYNTYGSKYSLVFQNIAINLLTEEATKYTAYNFFMDRGKIKDDFQFALDKAFNQFCFADIQFLQLRSVDLPNLFEQSIQESEVKKQDIQKAQAEQNKVKIEVDTKIKSAEYQKDVTVNMAQGEAEAILKQNSANVDAFTKMTNTQTLAYAKMKSELGLNNENLLNLLKGKIAKENKNIALNLKSPDKKG